MARDIKFENLVYDIHSLVSNSPLETLWDIDDICIFELCDNINGVAFVIKKDCSFVIESNSDIDRFDEFDMDSIDDALECFWNNVKELGVDYLKNNDDEALMYYNVFKKDCAGVRELLELYKHTKNANNYLYKIWDKARESYYSTGKKSAWKSKSWAENAVKDKCDSKYAVRHLNNFEIHKMELVVIESYNAETVVIDKIAINKEIDKLDAEINIKERSLVNSIGINVSYHAVIEMWKSGLFNDSVMKRVVECKKDISVLVMKKNELVNKIKNL